MTDFADSAAAMRARLEAYDSNRRLRRPRRRADERAPGCNALRRSPRG